MTHPIDFVKDQTKCFLNVGKKESSSVTSKKHQKNRMGRNDGEAWQTWKFRNTQIRFFFINHVPQNRNQETFGKKPIVRNKSMKCSAQILLYSLLDNACCWIIGGTPENMGDVYP